MAAATMHPHLPSTGGLRVLGSNAPVSTDTAPDECRQKEKDFIAQFEDEPRPLSPKFIAQDQRNKRLGMSSKHLRLQDFELLKTLGTGALFY